VTAGFLEPGAASRCSIPLQAAPVAENKVGRRVGHYELVERIGAGGMGEVYRARDLALGRKAALKLLPPSFDPDLRIRLIHEAEASAKLQHPAIATFYEAGDADGETFIAMEFVRGQTLRERLRHGAIPPERALAITCALLEALAHAHAAGLVHRDIKPENIVVSGDDAAKLLDFGIAAPLASSDGAVTWRPEAADLTVTTDGGLVGTPGYLAPEQLAGDPLDARTDVFQVGVVLYEMLTGTPAFGGASFLDLLTALLTSEPDLTAIAASGAPAGLIDVLRRAVARAPADRYQSARAFLTDLRELTERQTMTAVPRVVAVIDLENRTGDSELDWLGSALSEHLRATLATLRHVTVIARQKLHGELRAVERQTGDADPIAASLRLGCGWAITGHFERSVDMIDVHTRVVDAITGEVIATCETRGEVHNLLALEDGLGFAILSVTGEVDSGEPERRDSIVEAHECYVRARLLIERVGKGSLEDARVLLERAVVLHERHADALAALAQTYALRSIATTSSSDLEAALAFAERALAVAPDHVRGLIWKGYALSRVARFDDAARAYQRAIELAPNDTEVHYFAATGLLFSGRRDTLPLLQRCVELDAGRGMFWLALGTAHLYLEHRKEALYCFGRARKLEDGSTPGGQPVQRRTWRRSCGWKGA
jgi:serine/threonine protein kinase